MSRPLLLDLFCGAGGAAVGYHRAEFEVLGVDINPQPRYPFSFIREDALEYARRYGSKFDAIHASPPCQSHTRLKHQIKNVPHRKRFRDVLEETQDVLRKVGLPWVIENVPGAPLEPTVILCGTTFDLEADGYELRRHRIFKATFPIPPVGPCRHRHRPVTVACSHVFVCKIPKPPKTWQESVGLSVGRRLMGIEWMNQHELGESIPPAYTEYIGRFLLTDVLRRKGLNPAVK